jgi:hypothetical protein
MTFQQAHNQLNDEAREKIFVALIKFIVDDKQAFSLVEKNISGFL